MTAGSTSMWGITSLISLKTRQSKIPALIPGRWLTMAKLTFLYRNRGDGTFEDVTRKAGPLCARRIDLCP